MRIIRSTTLAAALVLAACSDSTGPTMGTGVSLTFASDVTAGGAAAPGLFGAPMAGPITDGVNTLNITSVKVVLREIELRRVEVADCDVEPEPDGCEKFETAPVLVDLPVDGSTSQGISIDIDPGTYTDVEFDIHEVTDDDAAFLVAHPEMDGKSITVSGTFNGAAFEFETNMSQEQKLSLTPNLVVGDEAPAHGLFQAGFLGSPGIRIAGGSDEILRNIIAERVLQLPGDIRVDRGVAFSDIPSGSA